MTSRSLPIANPLIVGALSLAPHRTLSLKNGDVAILAERSTGWCVVQQDAYRRLVEFLEIPIMMGQAPEDSKGALLELWNAGLLLAGGQAHPDTKRPVEQYPSSLLLKLTGACNFDCTYCYDYDEKRFKTRLSFERVRETIEFLLSKREHLSITFHGGEPLLRFDLIKEVVRYTLSHVEDSSRIRFSIQTNGSLFKDEVVSFLEQYGFSVGISIDGADEESNSLRQIRGRYSAWEHIQNLLKRYPQFLAERCGFLAVASKTSAPSLPALALWLQDQNISGLTVTFLDLVGRGVNLAHEKLTPVEAVQLYADFVAMIKTKQIEKLALRSVISRINNLFTFQPQDFCHKGPCGAAGDFLVLDSEGAFRSCDCIYDSYFMLGKDIEVLDNFSSDSTRRSINLRHDWLREEGADCRTCALFGLCGGTCVAKAIANNQTDKSVDPIDCAITRWIYPLLLEEFAENTDMPVLNYYLKHKPLVLN